MLDQGSTEPPAGKGDQALDPTQKRPNKPVKSTYPDHVWQIDFTLVPTSAGFWVPWLPHAVPQRWPFCWWVACVVDHFSRRVVGFTVFEKQPSVCRRTLLSRADYRQMWKVAEVHRVRPRDAVRQRWISFLVRKKGSGVPLQFGWQLCCDCGYRTVFQITQD